MNSLRLADIRTDGGTQPRAETNWIVVADYAEAMLSGAQFPPVVVFYDGTDYWLADGFHRVLARQQAALESIQADVRQGTREDAVIFSCGANAKHGQRRTNQDKRRAVETLVRLCPDWKIQNIADHCGVSVGMAHAVRSELESTFQVEKLSERKGADGKKRPTTYAKKKAPASPTTPPVQPSILSIIRHTEAADDRATIAALARVEPELQPQVAEALAAGSSVSVQRIVHEIKREEQREENRALVQQTPAVHTIARAKYPTLVIDPPWDWSDEGDADQFGRARPDYATMTLDEIAALPVGDLAERDAHLYLWITNRSLPKGFDLLRAWGFRYVTALTWVKPSIGMGNYFRGSTEHVLFGVRGSLPLLRSDIGTWFSARRPGPHSAKPSEFFQLVEECSPGPWLELFSRQERNGWTAWGEKSA